MTVTSAAPTLVTVRVGLGWARDDDETEEQNKSVKPQGDGSETEARKLLQHGSNSISLHGSILYRSCVL